MKNNYDWIEKGLNELRAMGLERTLRKFDGVGGKFHGASGKILNFSSNDYLGLTRNERIIAAGAAALKSYGAGATSSRLVSGTLPCHSELEERLAKFKGYPAALVFGSGYLANLGVIQALVGREDVIFADRLAHASMIDGAVLSRAELKRFQHNEPGHLSKLLQNEKSAGRKLVMTESVFSMDGDLAPLKEISSICAKHGAMLLVDEAHATGVFGPSGAGLVREYKLDPKNGKNIVPDVGPLLARGRPNSSEKDGAPPFGKLKVLSRVEGQAAALQRNLSTEGDPGIEPENQVTVSMGTLSKAIGSYGGFVACSTQIRDWFINRARSFIYSTALPPAVIRASTEALDILESKETLGRELLERAGAFRKRLQEAGFNTGKSASQIIPLIVGKNQKALGLAERLREKKILVVAIRPPTVPEGTARIRLSVTLDHSRVDLDQAADQIIDAGYKEGIIS